MIRKFKNTAAVILAVAGMAFATVALAAPAGAASASPGRAAGPDFACHSGAVCTFYGEKFDNSPHTWWPGNKSGKWYNFHKLGVNNPGSLRNDSSYCVWVGTKPGGEAGPDFRSVDGNERTGLVNLQHDFGWFYITAIAECGPQPPN